MIEMLHGGLHLSLRMLNDATAAWVVRDYNRKHHEAIGMTPLDRFLSGRDAGRPAPGIDELRAAFRRDVVRTVRRSDGTTPLEGRRFEIPNALRTLRRVRVRYASWDLGLVHLVDERTGEATHRIYPVDLARNAEGRRRSLDPVQDRPQPAVESSRLFLPPLLEELLRAQDGSQLPPAYLPKDEHRSSRTWTDVVSVPPEGIR